MPDESAAAALRCFVPAAVLSRLGAGQDRWLAEFRLVVTLFVNVGGVDYEAADAPGRIASAVAAMREAVLRYDGAFHQFIVDDKGTTCRRSVGPSRPVPRERRGALAVCSPRPARRAGRARAARVGRHNQGARVHRDQRKRRTARLYDRR
jgi:hypothetical protein